MKLRYESYSLSQKVSDKAENLDNIMIESINV